MSSRNELVREVVFLATALGSALVLLVAVLLTLGGAFSWLGFARVLLLGAVVVGVVELIVLQRVLRVNHVRGPLTTWRREDPKQGCSIALLGALIALGLLLCGGLMEWWLEFR